MDTFLFQKINSLAGIHSFVDNILWFFAHPFGYILVAFLVLVLIWPQLLGLQERFPVALALASALFARFFIKNLIVFFYNRPRPFDILEINQLVPHDSFGSFPSGHAIFFFALAIVLIFYSRKSGYLFLGAATLISLARVSAGIHWPSDIIAGASLGILIGVLAFILYKKISGKISNIRMS